VSLRRQDVCALELESIKLTRAHTSACRGPEAARSRSHVLDCSPAPFRLECLVDSAKVQEEKPGGGREAGENEVKRKSALREKKKYARTIVSHLRKERFGVRSVLRSSALVTGEVIWAGRRAGARDKSNLDKFSQSSNHQQLMNARTQYVLVQGSQNGGTNRCASLATHAKVLQDILPLVRVPICRRSRQRRSEGLNTPRMRHNIINHCVPRITENACKPAAMTGSSIRSSEMGQANVFW